MPIRFRGPVRPKKLKSPDPIKMPVVRNDKVPRIKSDVLYYKENGSLPTEPGGDFNPSDFYTDPVTGLKWLRLTHTTGVPIDEVISDPKYAGMRMVTLAEVDELLFNFFGKSFVKQIRSPTTRLSTEKRVAWQDTFGITGPSAGNSYGSWIDDTGGTSEIKITGPRDYRSYMYHGYGVGTDTSTARDQDGVFLVQE